jgi:class 3 adenylate cyclase/CHASE2 domain-containing sensor protein
VVVAVAAVCAWVGYLSTFASPFPALGGPNAPIYDTTLLLTRPWRNDVPVAPALFVAIDTPSLSRPEYAALPRALFQPIWSRLIEGLVRYGARLIAFDVVFAYAGADFRVGDVSLADYDRALIESLRRNRDKIVLGRYPSLPPAPLFSKAVGALRVGALDLQTEMDGRVRSVAPLVRTSEGRQALAFAGVSAGLSVDALSSIGRLFVAPTGPVTDIPTYSLASLLDCLSSGETSSELKAAIEGRVVVIGTAVAGEDEHRGPARFLGHSAAAHSAGCAPRSSFDNSEGELVPGALLQIAALQSSMRDELVQLAPGWMRAALGAILAGTFSLLALRDRAAFSFGERDFNPRVTTLVQLGRSTILGILAPLASGTAASGIAFLFHIWLPTGYPVLTTSLSFMTIVGIRSARHRSLFRKLYQTAGRYLPPARLSAMARSGFADVSDGQEREVSILLADLVGFTAFSNDSARSASEVVEVANRYFTLMQSVIDRYGGCSDKFLGDAVLAFWNGLSDDPDHASKAVSAAHDILAELNGVQPTEVHRLTARAVVCSGRVYVGDLGAKQRRNFTIIGPAVNETFRLEKLPDLFGLDLLVADTTVRAIRGSQDTVATLVAGPSADPMFVRIDDVELKGFPGLRSIFALVPADDPGIGAFTAGRRALDARDYKGAAAELNNVKTGILSLAARRIAAQIPQEVVVR